MSDNRPMEVMLANPRGFCAGVERAIDIVEVALSVCPPPVYVRREIVHNRLVVETLRQKGAIFVDELDEVADDATVIFSAHGISPAVREEARRRGLRVGWLPFSPLGPGPLHGSFEVGLEPLYQRYTEPHDAFFAGLGLTGRYHFLSLGRFVPYVEGAAVAGGTDLKIREIASDFTFVVWVGAGMAYFVTDRTALYGGYRYQHVSNGNTEVPNRGFESHTGVAGVSFFFQ